MPTYEYRCQDCGHTVEVVQSFSDAPLTVCEVCGGRLRRVFHPVGIVLKGSGFYSTDNRSGKRPSPSAKPAKDDASKSESSSSSSSSDSATASKPSGGDSGSGGSGEKAS
jgi:putative FmdB family regulatory protein